MRTEDFLNPVEENEIEEPVDEEDDYLLFLLRKD